MKMLMKLSLLAVTALALAGCETPTVTNTNTNTNTNAAPKAAMPTAETLMALENKAWEAYKNKDVKFFEGFLGENMISGTGEGTMSRADAAKMIGGHSDTVKSFTFSDSKVTPIGADAAVLTYKAVVDGTENGKPIPSPMTVATVFVRSGTDWKAVYHEEVAIIDPAKPAPAGNKAASADSASSDTAGAEKKAAPAAPLANSNSGANSNATASNSNSSAPSAVDTALTDALMAIEKKGWEGWKAKDAKALEEVSAKDLVFVDPTGKATFGKADVMKMWTTDNNCNVSSFSLSDGKAMSITKDAAILVVKGTAVGTCGDMKLTPLWNTSVFVKEGDAWKLAYMLETPVS